MSIDARTDFSALQKLLRKPTPAAPGERCDFCAVPIHEQHSHLIDLKARRIMCGCRPCALTFEPQGAAGGRYKLIPERYLKIDGFAVDDNAWDTLQIPIGLAFFFYNSIEKKLSAFYPGPAGATESELPLDEWQEMIAGNAVLATLKPDVEAILMRRTEGKAKVYLIPVDAAYELVGLIRTGWRGFDGGVEVKAKIDAFFERIEQRA
jgi:hypothetical protein